MSRRSTNILNVCLRSQLTRLHWATLVLMLGTGVGFGCEQTAELPQGFVRKTFTDAQGQHPYILFLPAEYSAQAQWPIVLFLHGAGEKGTKGLKPITVGLGTALSVHPNQKFIAVFPQSENVRGQLLTSWLADSPDGKRALAILDQVESEYAVNSQRRILCGWSMGGYGAWSLAAADPERWAGVLAISGGQTEQPLALQKLAERHIPVWAVHGTADELIPDTQSAGLVAELNRRGGSGTLTLVPGVGHDVWRYLFADLRTWQWLESPATKLAQSVKNLETEHPLPERSFFYVEQFTHLQTLPDMISLRMGNSALSVISEGIPEVIPSTALSGTLPDIERVFQVGEESIQVQLSDIEFECKVADIKLTAISGGRFRSRFELNPLRLKIGGTTLKAGSTTATTGPFQIDVGHREPVALEIEIQPSIGNAGLELIPLRQRFSITDKNWYIHPPEQVQVDSQVYTPANIVTGIVGGLYLQKEEIEKTVLGVVPSLLQVVENELKSREAPKLARLLWPLPALVPELSIAPSQVRTDTKGISLIFDMQIRTSSATKVSSTGPTVDLHPPHFDVTKMRHSQDLDFGVSLAAVDRLGEFVIQDGYAYINVLDLPDEQLKTFASREIIGQIFKGFMAAKDDASWDAGLRLMKPFQIRSVAEPGPMGTVTIEVDIPHARYEVVNRKTMQQAMIDFSLSQNIQIETVEKAGVPESLKINWLPNPIIQVISHENQPQSVNATAFNELLTDAWGSWTKSQSGAERAIPRMQFGASALSLETFTVKDGVAELSFGALSKPVESASAGQ